MGSLPTRFYEQDLHSNRVNFLAILRALACLSIFLSHTYQVTFMGHYAQVYRLIVMFGYDITFLVCPPGHMGVWVLFTLSGYLMGKVFYTKRYTISFQGICNFFRNRALRLLPLYYFACIVTLILVYPNLWHTSNWHLVTDVFLLRNHNTSVFKHFNPILWSIATEGHFYILVPLLFFVLKHCFQTRRNAIIGILLLIIISTVYKWFLLTHVHVNPYTMLLPNLNVFLTGMILYPLLKSAAAVNPKRFKWHRLFSCVLLVGLAMVYENVEYHNFIHPEYVATAYIFPPLTALITAYAIYVFEQSEISYGRQDEFTVSNLLKNPWRLFEILALLSYGIYIWHGPIILMLHKILPTSGNLIYDLVLLTIVSLWATIMLSIATFFLIEKPFYRFKALINKEVLTQKFYEKKPLL